MGPPSYMWPVLDQNIVMRRIPGTCLCPGVFVMKVYGFPGNTCQLRAEASTNHLYFKRQNCIIFRMPSHAQSMPQLYTHHFQNFNLESNSNHRRRYWYKGRILGASHAEWDVGEATN